MIHGSCLCGGVRFDISRPPTAMDNCHCSMCRKAHGTAFATHVEVERAAFRYAAGEALVRRYRSSPPVHRSFCSTCGSQLTFEFSGRPDAVWVSAGVLDDDPAIRPGAHIFVGSKAPWHAITDDALQHETYPPAQVP